jgi:hypothetical protein
MIWILGLLLTMCLILMVSHIMLRRRVDKLWGASHFLFNEWEKEHGKEVEDEDAE